MARKFWVNTDRNAAVTKAIKDIDKYSESVQTNIRGAIRCTTDAVKTAAMGRAPVRTGNLKKSIDGEISRDGLSGFVSAKSPVALLI